MRRRSSAGFDVNTARTSLVRLITDTSRHAAFDVSGSECFDGSANLELSRRRAASVVRWLAEHGVTGARLEGWGCGELHPTEPNRTSAGRQSNRRVEFHIVTPAPANGARAPEGCVQAE